MNPSPQQRFATLFSGRTDVWGALYGQAIKEPVTQDHYHRHLEGRVSLGIYPLRPDNRVRWCAIDIDILDVELAISVFKALETLGVRSGVYIEKSKGKGFHVLVIFSDWCSAVEVRQLAKAALTIAGLPATTEIFPKQDRLTAGTPWGNYLNLPYFGGDNPEGRRMVLDSDILTPVSLHQWLEAVETFPAADLPLVVAKLEKSPESSPAQSAEKPSLNTLLSKTHVAGIRRPTLVSIAGHLRIRGIDEDVAVMLLLPWAREHYQPGLPNSEVERHIRGIYRRYGVVSQTRKVPRTLPSLEVGP